MVTKERFKEIPLAVESVILPELGEEDNEVFIHQLSARQMADYILKVQDDQEKGEKKTIRDRLLVLSVRNADGAQIFEDKDVDDIGNLPQKVVVALYSVASRLNPMSDADDEKKAAELKNSQAPSTDSSTP